MLNIPLMLLGSVSVLITIMMAITLMIAGDLKKPANVKLLTASGIIGLLMIALSVLPWGIAVVGVVVLAVGGLAFFLLIWLPRYGERKLSKEVFEVRRYVKREYIKPVLRFLARVGIVSGTILLLDVIGLWAFLFSQRPWDPLIFTELLILLLLGEGSIIGGLGAFMFYGYSEYRLMGQAALWPSFAGEQTRGWRERRLSQQKWGIAMLIAGILLIFLGLLVGSLASL